MRKIDVLRDTVNRLQREIDAVPVAPVAPGGALARPVIVPVDGAVVSAISEAPKAVFRDDAPGDPLAAYVSCLKSLCETSGGTWVDDDPNRPAGCHFKTNVEAAGYGLFAWSCIPGGLLKSVLS
jgi:hypothetical protein